MLPEVFDLGRHKTRHARIGLAYWIDGIPNMSHTVAMMLVR